MADTLEIFSEMVSWSVLLFIFSRALATSCFNTVDWTLTLIALLFSYFVRYISKMTKTKEAPTSTL